MFVCVSRSRELGGGRGGLHPPILTAHLFPSNTLHLFPSPRADSFPYSSLPPNPSCPPIKGRPQSQRGKWRHIRTHTHTHAHTHAHTHMQTHIHAITHTHKHTHITAHLLFLLLAFPPPSGARTGLTHARPCAFCGVCICACVYMRVCV